MQQKASDAAGQAADKVREAGETLRGQVEEQVGARSTQTGEQMASVGDSMRQAGDQLRSQGNVLPAQLAAQAAAQTDRLGRYLRESDGETILRDVEDFARRQPWIVAGVGLAVGLGAARLLKASGRRAGAGGVTGTEAGGFDLRIPAQRAQPLAAQPSAPYAATAPPPAPVPSTPPAPSFARPEPPREEDAWARPEGR
jgi:ElaB/YqjD/DUF883 family membrane-anchored ribosome-binding protein